ncbi:MAG: protein kinase [Planctomycetota bacterium]
MSDHPLELEELLVECIEAADSGGAAAVERTLAQYPEHAEDLRRLLGNIEGLGGFEHNDAAERDVRVGPFRLLGRLGAGGMGVVFLARQEPLQRLVAIKVLAAGRDADPAARERLRREAEAVARLRHPNIVAVFDAGEHEGRPYFAMEYVPGRTLAAVATTDAFALRQVLSWGRDIARALQAAHDVGLVHRDVKPTNILIDEGGRAMLLDFGLAMDAAAPTLSRTGSFQGSPHYAAPEQVRGERHRIGPATDVYGLAVTLFEVVARRVPFEGDTTEAVFYAILNRDAPLLRSLAPHLPRDLEYVLRVALERDPERRYGTAAAFADDLEAVLELRPVRARALGPSAMARRWLNRHRRLAVAVLLAVLAVLGVAGGLWWRDYSAAEQRRADAERAVSQARAALKSGRDERRAATLRFAELQDQLRRMTDRYQTRSSWAQLDREFVTTRRRLRQAEDDLQPHADRLAALAQQLGDAAGGVGGFNAARAGVGRARAEIATALGEASVAARLRAQAAALLPIDAPETFAVGIRCDEVAAVHVFRYEQATDSPRLVAIPWAATDVDYAGGWVLRIATASPPLLATDHITHVEGEPVRGSVWVTESALGAVSVGRRVLELDGQPVTELFPLESIDPNAGVAHRLRLASDLGSTLDVDVPDWRVAGLSFGDARSRVERGGVSVTVVRHGVSQPLELDGGVRCRVTASPLLTDPQSFAGRTPLELDLPAGSYVAQLQALPGGSTVRVPFDVGAPVGRVDLSVTWPRGRPGPDFVPVAHQVPGVATPYWVQDHEVTMAEYLEFLNSEEAASLRAMSASPALYPRDSEKRGSWLPKRDGEVYYLPWHYAPETPVIGISLEDAQAYARWRTERARAHGERWGFRVPSIAELDAVRDVSPRYRPFVAGREHRPTWVKARFSREQAALEPGLRYPIDEVPHGVFDLAGSAFEWTATPSTSDPGHFVVCGASWNSAGRAFFRMNHRFNAPAQLASPAIGFRLVARPDP